MSDLATFTEHVQDVLCDAYRVPHWTPEEAGKYMAEYGVRRHRFEELAHHLNEEIVKPRLEMVASYLKNACMQEGSSSNGSACWFEFCERFPTFAQLEFTIEHDVRFDKLIVQIHTRMMPVFVRFNEKDNLLLPLDAVDDEEVADWVEERLLEFLDTYLRIDAGGEDFTEEPVTDPVCGMQLDRLKAAASDSYYGHSYYFCCEGCLTKFQKTPEQYAQIKTM